MTRYNQPDGTKVLLDERQAVLAGTAVTLLGLLLSLFVLAALLNIIGQLVGVAIAGWLVGMVAQYWVAESYKDGLTIKELTMAVLWPMDMVRAIRAGVRGRAVMGGFGGHIPASEDDSKTLINEKAAVWGGVGATAVALVLSLFTFFSVLDIIGTLIWVIVALYPVGMAVQFWTSNAYKKGLTTGELFLMAAWPLDMIGVIRDGVKHDRQRKAA